jgi:hypothetical protein
MRFWFSRRDRKADKVGSARKQRKEARGARARNEERSGPPQDDPIKNWETADQKFLREAGDPFLDG